MYTPIILYFLTSTLTSKSLESAYFPDINYRVDSSNFAYDNLMLYWTNISYLYLFLPLILFILLNFLLVSNKLNNLYFCLMFYFTLALLDFQSYNYFSLTIGYQTQQLSHYNILLMNGLNKYHPLMLYLSWLFTFIYVRNLILNNLKSAYNYQPTIENFYSYIATIIFTLSLGAWWAYQEGSWGGWWNWDPSEVFGLSIMLVMLTLHHLAFYQANYHRYFTLIICLSSALLLYYTFMQLNFELISHNFGLRNADSVDVRFLFSVLCILVTAFIAIVHSTYWESYLATSYFLKDLVIIFVRVMSKAVIAMFIFLSLTILINDLGWKLLTINFINLNPDYYQLLVVLTCIFYISIFNANIYCISVLILSLLLSNYLPWLIVYFLVMCSVGNYRKIHILMLIIMFINLALVKIDLSNWHFLSSQFSSYSSVNRKFSSYWLDKNNITLNFPFVNSSTSFNYYLQTKLDNISTMYNDSTTDVRMFNLLKTNNYTTQGLISDSSNYVFTSNFSNLLYNTLEVVILIILSYLSVYRKKNEIITI